MADTDPTETTIEVLTFSDLNAALSKCMAAHPPAGLEFEMHLDANTMANLWALMNYERSLSTPIDQVKPEVLDAYRRWT